MDGTISSSRDSYFIIQRGDSRLPNEAQNAQNSFLGAKYFYEIFAKKKTFPESFTKKHSLDEYVTLPPSSPLPKPGHGRRTLAAATPRRGRPAGTSPRSNSPGCSAGTKPRLTRHMKDDKMMRGIWGYTNISKRET